MVDHDALETIREQAANCVCSICEEPVTVHDGSHLVTEPSAPAIADAVEHANRHPSNNARDGDVRYVVEDGYYPDDKEHFIDLSEVPADLRKSASIDIISHLTKRGLYVNSVRWDPPRLHVMATEDAAFDYYGGDSA
jgi:hypothetical protein